MVLDPELEFLARAHIEWRSDRSQWHRQDGSGRQRQDHHQIGDLGQWLGERKWPVIAGSLGKEVGIARRDQVSQVVARKLIEVIDDQGSRQVTTMGDAEVGRSLGLTTVEQALHREVIQRVAFEKGPHPLLSQLVLQGSVDVGAGIDHRCDRLPHAIVAADALCITGETVASTIDTDRGGRPSHSLQ